MFGGLPDADSPALQMASHYSTQHSGYMAPQVDHAQACDDSLRNFWATQLREIQQTSTDPAEFKNQQLPLTRIKKVPVRPVFDVYAN
jgi:hypothetical protein